MEKIVGISLVTVVTVTYNAQDLLEKTILSVLGQTYSNIEYIIIDGGSSDNTVNIIKKYEEKISYWVSEPDEGIYFAMNKAIEKATGEWINFMNAGDTFVDSTTIGKVIDRLDEETELIYGDHMCDGVIGSVKNRKITRLMPCCHQSLFVKTQIHKEYLYNTTYKIAADYDVLLRMYLDGKKFQYIEEPVAHYQRGGFSDSNTTRWYIEVLTLLMNNNVPMEDIMQSPAYYLISKTSEIKQLKHELDQQCSTNQKIQHHYNMLLDQLSKISKIQAFKHPWKKLKSYKDLMSLYHQYKH